MIHSSDIDFSDWMEEEKEKIISAWKSLKEKGAAYDHIDERQSERKERDWNKRERERGQVVVVVGGLVQPGGNGEISHYWAE